MKRIIKQDLSITLAVLAIAIFAFFFWMYPYHLFHKEQMMLFLYSAEFLRGYFQEEAWLACLTGDFLTQFFYYIGGGPFILSVVLTLFALLTYRTFRQFVSKRYALPLMILLILWEAGRSCGLAYPLSATLSLIGAEGVFLLYSRSQTEGRQVYYFFQRPNIPLPLGGVSRISTGSMYSASMWNIISEIYKR